MPAASSLVIGGSALLGAGSSIVAGNKAAKAQRQAADQASATEMRMFEQTREDQKPYREAGYRSLAELEAGMKGDLGRSFTLADYQADPGYAFRLNEGTQALERSAAARGGLLSGGTLKDLTAYSQGMASQEYNNAYNRWTNDQTTQFNRLAAIAGIGQTATNNVNQIGTQVAGNVANNQLQAGNARASAYANTGASIGNAVSGGLQNYMFQNQMKIPTSTTTVPGLNLNSGTSSFAWTPPSLSF